MAKYYVTGYTTPADVTGRDDVKRYQKMLGVTVDGIWGKNTQRAYNQYKSKRQKNSTGKAVVKKTTAPESSFSDGFDWAGVSEKIKANLIEILRPAVDSAIENRRNAAETNKAELDADSAARGMESSTYVSSVKARENESMADDISDYEANYNSALASSLQSTLMSVYETYTENKNSQRNYEMEQRKLAQEQTQFEEQMALEREQMAAQERAAKSSGSSSSGKGGKSNAEDNGLGYSFADYKAYMETLEKSDVTSLFSSEKKYWKWMREQIVADIGYKGYYVLFDKYSQTGDSSPYDRYAPENQYAK